MSADTRVFGESVQIDSMEIKEFFENRGRNINPIHPLTSVLYQDLHPDIAERRHAEESAIVTPLLGLNTSSKVLDIGCGIGRWAGVIAAGVAQYTGVDVSESLCSVARQSVNLPSVEFVCADVAGMRWFSSAGRTFDRFIVSGLLLYLNDEDVRCCLDGIAKLSEPGSLVYLREPLASSDRLTLRSHWSEELNAHYSAVYRTRDELEKFVNNALAPVGFEPCCFRPLFEDNALNNRVETKQHFCIVRRPG
jgi:SAM-dependent methyltransferase